VDVAPAADGLRCCRAGPRPPSPPRRSRDAGRAPIRPPASPRARTRRAACRPRSGSPSRRTRCRRLRAGSR
jgi:hypothetical protein